MSEQKSKIAAGLEREFAARGFAEPSVEDLRDASGVSLRTLYKYLPSRDEMVYAALEHRHHRYLAHIFDGLEPGQSETLNTVIERIADWMKKEASHGCLFHSAVAAAPADDRLRNLLIRHKAEIADKVSRIANLPGKQTDIVLVLEGLTQSWPLQGQAAVDSAKRLCTSIGQD